MRGVTEQATTPPLFFCPLQKRIYTYRRRRGGPEGREEFGESGGEHLLLLTLIRKKEYSLSTHSWPHGACSCYVTSWVFLASSLSSIKHGDLAPRAFCVNTMQFRVCITLQIKIKMLLSDTAIWPLAVQPAPQVLMCHLTLAHTDRSICLFEFLHWWGMEECGFISFFRSRSVCFLFIISPSFYMSLSSNYSCTSPGGCVGKILYICMSEVGV